MWSHKFFLKDNFMLYIQVPRNDSQKKVPKKVARKSTHKKCPEKVLTKSTQKGAQIRRSVNQSFVNVAFPSLFWGRLFKQCNIWWLRDIINILTVYFCFYFWIKKYSTVYKPPWTRRQTVCFRKELFEFKRPSFRHYLFGVGRMFVCLALPGWFGALI